MTDLTTTDVHVLRQYLHDTREAIERWLPQPQWVPTWQSEAERECANTETGPGGPWGSDTIHTVYAGGALYLDTILRCLRAISDALTPETTPYVINTLARAAMEAGAQLWWLLEPGIGARRRVARFWVVRASGARYLDNAVQAAYPQAPAGMYGETPAMVSAAIANLGLNYSERHVGRRWSWTCEGETMPGYTARAKAFEDAVRMVAAYSIYSADVHAEWHAIIAGWRQEPFPGGGTTLTPRPDLTAAAGAILASAGFAVVPAHRALALLGRNARSTEIAYHARKADDLIHRLSLPKDWSRWLR